MTLASASGAGLHAADPVGRGADPARSARLGKLGAAPRSLERIDRRLFTRPVPWSRRPEVRRAVLVLLGVFAVLRLLFELPAEQLHLAAVNVATAEWARQALAALGVPLRLDGQLLVHAQGFVTEVHQLCTALIPAALLATAIALHPRHGRRARLAGVLACVPLVVLVNQARLVGVIWVGVRAPEHFALVHGVLAPLALVGACAAFWWVWARAMDVQRGHAQ